MNLLHLHFWFRLSHNMLTMNFTDIVDLHLKLFQFSRALWLPFQFPQFHTQLHFSSRAMHVSRIILLVSFAIISWFMCSEYISSDSFLYTYRNIHYRTTKLHVIWIRSKPNRIPNINNFSFHFNKTQKRYAENWQNLNLKLLAFRQKHNVSFIFLISRFWRSVFSHIQLQISKKKLHFHLSSICEHKWNA